jgi:hypothetical protein
MKGIQSITDGCSYQLNEFFSIKKHPNLMLPGLETLSNFEKLQKHRFIQRSSLANLDWKLILSENTRDEDPTKDFPLHREIGKLDNYAKEHLERFWNFYGLKIQYSIEHKL